MNITSLRSEPFLWIHLAGIVLLPALLAITMIALSIGNSYDFTLELLLLSGIGIVPIVLMQWTRPFDIFSILLFSIQPERLTDEQRVILSLLKTFKQKLFGAIATVLMLVVLWLVYSLSPLFLGVVNFLPQWRILGLSIAAMSFLASNLFLQIPLSVLLVLMTNESQLTRTAPYALEEIETDFTIPGIKIPQILWFISSEIDS